MTVETPNKYHEANDKKWQMIDDLMEDVTALQKKSQAYLPQNPAEGPENYKSRVRRTSLFPGLKKAINQCVSKPFAKAVTLEQLPKGLTDFSENMDGNGRNATEYGNIIMKAGLKYGNTHVLVDVPYFIDNEQMTNAKAKEMKLEPYCIHITPRNMLDWETVNLGSKVTLTEIRYKETERIKTGEFTSECVEQIRVVRPTEWQIWRKTDKNDKYVLAGQGTIELGYIPLYTFYADQTGFMTADMPFIDLAFLNIENYGLQSDYRNNLYYAGQVMLAQTGVTTNERKANSTAGANRILSSANKDAKFFYVEHTAAATGAMRTAIQDNQEEQEVLGLKPLSGARLGQPQRLRCPMPMTLRAIYRPGFAWKNHS